jgi:hypothetical protein
VNSKGMVKKRIRMKIWQGTYSWRDCTNELIDIQPKLLCVPSLEQGIDVQHVSHESALVKSKQYTEKSYSVASFL